MLSNPAYAGSTLRPASVTSALARFRASGDHAFWPATLSLTDERVFDLSVASGHTKLTDVYLLGLATTMSGCLATFRSHSAQVRVAHRRPVHDTRTNSAAALALTAPLPGDRSSAWARGRRTGTSRSVSE